MNARAKPPRHFWAVTVLSVLWNGFGLFDFLMINARNAAYIAHFPAEGMQLIDATPYWALGAWAANVGAGALGALLMVLRSRYAGSAFAVSLVGLVANMAYNANAMPGALWSGVAIGMTVLTAALAIGQLWYASRMRKAGVLR